MKISAIAFAFLSSLCCADGNNVRRRAEPPTSDCMEVTLTGTMGGPWVWDGLAGPGTLVTFGSVESGCKDKVALQFDAGRGTVQQLSKLGYAPPRSRIDGVFLTHMHSDHTDGLSDLLQLNWQFTQTNVNAGKSFLKLPIVCAGDAMSPDGRTISCEGLLNSIDLAFEASGEIGQRYFESLNDPNDAIEREDGGPSELIDPTYVPYQPGNPTEQLVFSKNGVEVFARGSVHIPGHLSYKIVTPVGTAVITGDAGRPFGDAGVGLPSTSPQVEQLAANADILVQSAIHPIFAPGAGSTFPAFAYNRQANTIDIGAMAKRINVGTVMLTHLIPSLGCDNFITNVVPGGALKEHDFKNSVKAGGYTGKIVVGTDLASVRIP